MLYIYMLYRYSTVTYSKYIVEVNGISLQAHLTTRDWFVFLGFPGTYDHPGLLITYTAGGSSK